MLRSNVDVFSGQHNGMFRREGGRLFRKLLKWASIAEDAMGMLLFMLCAVAIFVCFFFVLYYCILFVVYVFESF